MASIECYKTLVLRFPVRCDVARNQAFFSIRVGSPKAAHQPFATFAEIIPFDKWRRDGLRLLGGGAVAMMEPERSYSERDVINLANPAATAVDGLLVDIGLGQYAINPTQSYRALWTKVDKPDDEERKTASPTLEPKWECIVDSPRTEQ